jgi:hypothetical protein
MSSYTDHISFRQPTSVRVGATLYKIEWFDNALWRKTDSRGQCDTIYGTISIYSEMAWSAQAETLAHEIMHAVINASVVPGGEKYNKEQVCDFAQAFHTVLQENPGVRNWMAEAYATPGDGREQCE